MPINRHRWRKLIFGFVVAAAMTGPASAAEPERLAMVSVLPQAEFVRAVGGDRVRVEVMVPPGRSHENYEPSPRQLQALYQAQFYFRIGLPFEGPWMARIRENNPGLAIIDTRNGVPLLPQAAEHVGHGHAAGSGDPHIWLDPNRVKIQAETIRAALAAADPDHAGEYLRNCRAFQRRLVALDADLRRTLAGAPSRRFMVYHPSWAYFAQAYGLEQIPIENEGKEPGPRSLARIITEAKRLGVKTVFVQKQFSPRSARVIAESIGGRVSTVEDVPADYFAALRSLAQAIAGQTP